MNKSTLAPLLIIAISWGLIIQKPTQVFSQSEATSGADLETIKENVIKRIQEVVSEKNNPDITKLSAFHGTLSSISANTISIQSLIDGGVNLASTSADTSYIRLPGNTSIDFDDLVIEEYVVAIGYLNQTQVLDTLRIITQKSPPSPPTMVVNSGTVVSYDSDEFELTLTDIQNQTVIFLLGRSSDINLIDSDGTKTSINRTQDIPPGSRALIVYEAVDEGDTPIPSEVLIKTPYPYVTPAEISQ